MRPVTRAGSPPLSSTQRRVRVTSDGGGTPLGDRAAAAPPLPASPVPAPAQRTIGLQHDVADLPGEAVRAPIQAPAEHDATTDARAHARPSAGRATPARPRTGTHPTPPRCCRSRRSSADPSACLALAASGTSRHARFGAYRITPPRSTMPAADTPTADRLLGGQTARTPSDHRRQGRLLDRRAGVGRTSRASTRPVAIDEQRRRSSCRRRRCRSRVPAPSRGRHRRPVALLTSTFRTGSPDGRRRSSPHGRPTA